MGDSRSTVMYKIVHEDPITLNVLNRTIPAGVSAAVMKALGKDPTQRFPTCSAFAAAVRVGMAGGTVEFPADANAGRRRDCAPGPAGRLRLCHGRCPDGRHRWAPYNPGGGASFAPVANGPCGGRRAGRPRGLDMVGAAGTGWRGMVGAARTGWPDLGGPARRGWDDDPRTDTCARCSGTRISGTGESRIQPTGSEHLDGRCRSRARGTSARCPRG